jgi:carboxymethylenebutenolidase
VSLAGGSQPVGAGLAYVAWPARSDRPLPVVLVVSDIWGDGEHLRDVANRVATSGYLAVAPDLYSSLPSDEALTPDRVAEARAWVDGLPPATWTDTAARTEALKALGPPGAPLAETLDLLFEGPADLARFDPLLSDAITVGAAHDAGDHGAVGAIGFCMGGSLAGRLACDEARLGAAVVFYGTPPPHQDLAGGSCPMLGLYGGEDHAITDAIPALADAMASARRRFEYHVYPDAPHAFFNDTRSAYRVDAARDAWVKALGFLSTELAADRP